MSSDESEPEEGPTGNSAKICRVKKRPWRAPIVDTYMILIDRDRNVKNVYGNYRAGNRPHVRLRPAKVQSIPVWIPPGLPRNLYDDAWYNTLSTSLKRDLDAKGNMTLMEFEPEDVYT